MAAERFTPRDDTDGAAGGRISWWTARLATLVGQGRSLGPRKMEGDGVRLVGPVAGCGQGSTGRARSGTATKTCPYCAEEIKQAAIKCKHCATWLVPVPEPARSEYIAGHGDNGPRLRQRVRPARLTRSTADAMAAGVLSGLGHFFGMDPTWLRIAYALGTIFTAIIPGIAVYAILALVIPGDAPDNGPSLG